jgi:hypothetical protein
MIKRLRSLIYSVINSPEKSAVEQKKNSCFDVSLAQFYGDHVPWELPVQHCASDCIKPGDIVLDVGGHVGGGGDCFGANGWGRASVYI